MKDDIMFKAFFSKIGNEKYLKSFLSAILSEDIKIKEVVHDSRLEQLAREQKYGILDLDVKLENGETINIEMQMQNHNNMEKRSTFYASKKITEQVGIGTKYDDIKRVIVISILNYSFLDVPEYVNKTVRVIDKHRTLKLNNIVEYYYIELEKFRKNNPNMKEPINQWLAFIDMEREDLLDMATKENKIIKEAKKSYNILTGEAEIKRLAEIRLMSDMEEQAALSSARQRGTEEGLKQGIEEGFQQGIEKGQKDALYNIAKQLLNKGFSINEIKKLTNLSENEIKSLK